MSPTDPKSESELTSPTFDEATTAFPERSSSLPFNRVPQSPGPPSIQIEEAPIQHRRGRARSNSIRGGVHPAEIPLNPSDQSLANLIHSINTKSTRAIESAANSADQPNSALISPVERVGRTKHSAERSSSLTRPPSSPAGPRPLRSSSVETVIYRGPQSEPEEGFADNEIEEPPATPHLGHSSRFSSSYKPDLQLHHKTRTENDSPSTPSEKAREIDEVCPSGLPELHILAGDGLADGRAPIAHYQSIPRGLSRSVSSEFVHESPDTLHSQAVVQNLNSEDQNLPRPALAPAFGGQHHQSAAMNYSQYTDQVQGQSANRPAPSPQNATSNGINGGALPGIMAGMPTPAGHQSDLNHLYGLVDDLSKLLAESRAKSERLVSSVGKVHQLAAEKNMSRDEIVGSLSAEFEASTKNLEEEHSKLLKLYDRACYDRDENMKLLREYAEKLGMIVKMAHAFKYKTTSDMCAWHRSYRNQLADEREENMNLRLQIQDMTAHAANGHRLLLEFRRRWDRSDHYIEMEAEVKTWRATARFWKRMALRYLPPDDPEFSDDDDEIDPEEKKRLIQRAEELKEKNEMLAEHAGEGNGAATHLDMASLSLLDQQAQ